MRRIRRYVSQQSSLGLADRQPAEPASPAEEPKVDSSILDPAKMQEMLNPQTMQLYLSQVRIPPSSHTLVQTRS